MQSKNINIRNITLEERIKDFARNVYSFSIVRPKKVLRLLANPSIIDGPTYFPEKKRRTKRLILWDQIRNIIFNEDIEEYYYLYGCDVLSRKEQKKFTPYMKFMRRRNRLNFRNEHNASCILRDKLFFGGVARTLGINTPENVGLTKSGTRLVIDIASSQTISLVEFLESLKGDFFCKPIDGECGAGVATLSVPGNNADTAIFNGVDTPLEEIATRLSTADFLIQKKISQHPEISKIYSKSINTVRLVTVRDINTGNIVVFPSVLRIGNLGNSVDNFSLGGVIVNIDAETGKLEKYGFMKSQYGTIMTEHPTSGIVFETISIPFMSEAVAEAIRFHSFLDLHSIGWDIAITESGPCFIEGNDNWEIDVQQNALHPLDRYFKQYFYKQ